MKLRKHIRADVLQQMQNEVEMGVPVARSMSKHLPDGSITRPTVVQLLKALAILDSDSNVTTLDLVASSLFPPWLDECGPAVQEQPACYDYKGTFPRGKWQCRT